MLTRTAAALLVLLALPSTAGAAPTACPEHFKGGNAPDLTNPKMTPKTRELCFRAFAVLHSSVTRTPLWAAERMTRASLKAAVDTPRKGSFHEEERLPADERSTLADFARSGYDRGHLFPAADAPDDASQEESFSLANMVPQVSEQNRGVWAGIEGAVRGLARQRGELYVVSGPLFQGTTLQRLKGRVFVPTALFKAVYDPKRNDAGAYVSSNAPGDAWQAISISQLGS